MFDAMPASTCDELPKGFSTIALASLVPLGSRTPRTSVPQPAYQARDQCLGSRDSQLIGDDRARTRSRKSADVSYLRWLTPMRA